MADDQIGEKEKIQILALEYNSLRSEINARISSIYQVAAIFAIVTAWILVQPLGAGLIVGICLSLLGFATCGWFIARDAMKASMRVQELELEINRRAGEKLLIWENEFGGIHHGYWQFGFFLRLMRSHAARRAQ